MTRARDDRGMMLGIVIVVMVLLMFGTAAVAALMAASWRSTLRVDADTEAANVLASSVNIVDALATGVDSTGASRTPERACKALHTDYTDPNNPIEPPSCPTGWTAWMSLPGRDGCDSNVLEGCWQAKFSTTIITVDLVGQQQQTLTGWTVAVQAAARCDQIPDTSRPAEEACETVTDPAALNFQPVPLPLYAAIAGGLGADRRHD